MKKIMFFCLSVVLVGCASNPSSVKVASPQRQVASTLSKVHDFGTAGFPKNYQGPFEVSLDSYQRKSAKVYLPKEYENKNHWPLVVLLHGFSGTAEGEDLYLGLRFRASLRGFILLTPEGTVTPKGTIGVEGKDLGGNQFWNATDTCCDFAKTGVDDSGYLLALIENMKQKYKVDSSRVYLIGHSNGGFMVNRLGCDATDTFAGIANLAGGTFKDPKNCKSSSPVPYLQIHAVDDKTIHYQGAPEYAGGQETVEQWLLKNGCSKKSVKGPAKDFVYLIPGVDTESTTWNQCRSGQEVAFWTIKSHEQSGHNSHVPLFQLSFMDAVLEFLMKQEKKNP